VKAGSTLLVPRGERRLTDVSVEVADNAMMTLAPDAPALRRMSLKAGRKDSVASVAKRYRVSAAQVAQWNSVGAGASFKPGQTVVVFVAAKATRGQAGKATRSAAARTKASGHPATRSAVVKHKARVRLARN
jgi:membrane-bound lytic murein transglycosylase D